MSRERVYLNPAARQLRMEALASTPRAFHRELPGYAPTALRELPALATELGVRRVFVKDESERLGLPAFKVLGASYAISRTLSARWGSPHDALPLERLRELGGDHVGVRLFAATDGNHGRAVAHVARLLGIPSTIYFPASLTAEAKSAITAEGAHTVELALPYDDVVERMVQDAASAPGDVVVVQTRRGRATRTSPAGSSRGTQRCWTSWTSSWTRSGSATSRS